MFKQRALLAVFFAYLAFIVYGSLIPFDLRLHSFDQALERFAQIRWLQLGAASRADWVANLVLYIPLALLGCGALAGYARTAGVRVVLVLFVLALCLAVAVAVEFTQIFFAPRTVSLNDLLAETLGTLIGIGLWLGARDRLAQLSRAFQSGGRQSIGAAIAAYLTLYLALAFFPFDFVISWDELAARLQSSNAGWLLAGTAANPLRGTATLFGEAIAIAPLGLLAALLAGRVNLGRTFATGALLGLVLELLQLLLVSGVTQGASVLIRGAGLTAGAYVGQQIRERGLLPVAHITRRLALPFSPFYLLSLLAVSGWFAREVLGTAEALSRFDTVQLVPFYFHYFTTEPVAMASLLANLLMYAPIGLYAWARHATIPRGRRFGVSLAATWAALLALPIELSKLWLAGKHPDFTNLLIGAAGSALSYALATWMARASTQADQLPEEPATAVAGTSVAPAAIPGGLSALSLPKVAALLALGTLAGGLVLHPLAIPWVAPLLIAYGALLWRYPGSWLLLLPMLLPVLDLAPYAGRLLLDEFDLLILMTLGLGYWRYMPGPAAPWASGSYRSAAILLLLSGVMATGLGLRPLLDGASASLASSHSALEGLLVGKGLFWALLLTPLLRRIPAEEMARVRQWLIAGLAGGLTLLGLVVAWERHRFVGLGDFDGIFRVTGNFSTMNNGGAYIEAFIAISFPALVVWTLQQRESLLRLGGVAAAALASYAMFVTFSRGGYAGLAVGLTVVVLTLWRSTERRRARQRLWLAGVALATAAAAAPVLLGGFAQGRLAQIEKDLAFRVGHWQHALGLMEPGVLPALTGMGFGRYPALYLWHSDSTRTPGTYTLGHEGQSTFLRLGAGEAYYLDQIVHLDRSDHYLLQARVRFHGTQQRLKIFLCEKALLYSFRCNGHELHRPEQSLPGDWDVLMARLNTAGLGDTGRWPEPTLKLSVASVGGEGAVDIDSLSLHDSSARELLVNGDFENGLARWLSATDRKLAWHIDQSLLEVYFAQGLLGIIAVSVSLFAAARTLLPRMRRGEPFAVAVGAGLAGFLTIGLLGSTMDAARTAFLFYFLILACGVLTNSQADRVAPSSAAHSRDRKNAPLSHRISP